MERRTLLKHGATAIAGAGAGYGLLEHSTDNAQASLTLEGKVKTVTLGFVVTFDVLSESGDVLATSQLSDTAEVSITNEAYQPDEHGSADGTGEVTIQT